MYFAMFELLALKSEQIQINWADKEMKRDFFSEVKLQIIHN